MSFQVEAAHQDVSLYATSEAQFSALVVKKVRRFPSHARQLRQFLVEFSHEGKDEKSEHFYMVQLQRLVDGTSTTFKVQLDHVRDYFHSKLNDVPMDDSHTPILKSKKIPEADDLLTPWDIQNNALRYKQLLYEACESIMKEMTSSCKIDLTTPHGCALKRLRDKQKLMEEAGVPIHLRVPYEIRLICSSESEHLSVRDVRAFHIGKLVNMEGVITKVTSVKPRLQVAYYKCLDCGSTVYQAIGGQRFMPLLHCESQQCSLNQRKGELRLILPDCIFTRYQEVRIQEPPNRVPPGSIPRTQKVIVEGNLTRQLMPGLNVLLSGILCPVEKSLFHEIMYTGLVTETVFHVEEATIFKKGYESQQQELLLMSQVYIEKLFNKYQQDPDLYEKLAISLAPSIHGMLDIKKILLLQLIGGVTEQLSDGMRLRGDIHVLLIGDPGVAKSQLLGQVASIAPRAHYTTGKGSSGVGLTASVVRDPTTGDFTLEGGAIVLADRGICCIDEFDKMDEFDRTAIHEVMEQQTVSISKAGLTTTLNARTSILAAANPQYGRYDLTKSPMQNINLPAALLSRFDIQFLILDNADHDADLHLARHVLKIHQSHPDQEEQIDKEQSYFDPPTIRALVGKSRTYNPKIPRTLINEMVDYYVELRQRERADRLRNEFNSYTTPRTLLAILRLSQALARLRFSDMVDRGDFEEALRLVVESKRLVTQVGKKAPQNKNQREDYQSSLVTLLKDIDAKYSHRHDWDGWIPRADVEELATRQGYSISQLNSTFNVYEELNVLQFKDDNKDFVGFSDRVASCH